MRWLTALIVCTLAGCASAQHTQNMQELDAAKLQAERDRAECNRLHPAPPVTPGIKCQAAANYKYLAVKERLLGNAHRDIDEKHIAQALLAAERFDKGELSRAEYQLELANSNVEANTHTRQRVNDDIKVRAAILAATPPPQLPTTTNCNTIGGMTSCTSY